MQSKVNLLEQLPKEAPIFLTPGRMWAICMGFFVFLFSSYLLDGWDYHTLSRKLSASKHQEDKLLSELETLMSKQEVFKSREALHSDIEKLSLSIERRKLLSNQLHKITYISTHGFSPYLMELSQNIKPGVWLKEIVIDNEGDGVTLKGSAVEATLVSDFVTVLKKTPSFSKVPFKLLRIQSNQKVVDFSLSSEESK